VRRLRHYVFVRHGQNWHLLMRFALVGATGVVVNLLVVVGCNKLGPDPQRVAVDLPLTGFDIRWYHYFAVVAFVVANVWNFQLNRMWTFHSSVHSVWIKEYVSFLVVGLAGLLLNLGLLTLMLHPGSIFALPTDVLDGSSGFRTPLYWAQLIAICIVTPCSFALNKVWTFSALPGRPTACDGAAG
jgi:putative flippase GtrA